MKYAVPIIVAFIIIAFTCEAQRVSVGLIVQNNEDTSRNIDRFWFAESNDIALLTEINYVGWWNSMRAANAICSLLKNGIHSLASTVPSRYYPLMAAYAKKFGLPLLTVNSPPFQANRMNNEITFVPDTSTTISVLMKYYAWNSFVFFYDEDDGPEKLQRVLETVSPNIKVHALFRISNAEEMRRHLLSIKAKNGNRIKNLLLSMEEKTVVEIIETLQYEKQDYHLILMNSVGIINNSFRPKGNHVITALTMINTNDSNYKKIESSMTEMDTAFRPDRRQKSNSSLSSMVILDMAKTLQKGFASLVSTSFNFNRNEINCLTDNYKISSQSEQSSYAIKQVVSSGLTGKIKFSSIGEREDYKFYINKITGYSSNTIGTWSPNTELNISDITSIGQNDGIKPTSRQKLTVAAILTHPYLTLKPDSSSRIGNERFEGYLKDLLDEIMKVTNWDCEIRVGKDGKYGYIPPGGEWNGIIGELVREEADIALADLTITEWRATAIDFSIPYLNLGLNILMKKPDTIDISSSSIEALAFIKIWSYEIWLLIALFYVILSFSTYGVSHFIGEPDRIRSLDTKLSDRLSLCSSFWFTFGSLVFRSTGIYPRTLSHRILTLVWWIFSLLLLLFYISSLTFTLMQAKITGPDYYSRSSFDVLQNAVKTGHPKIGLIKGGSTNQFFANSQIGLYKDYGRYLSEEKDVFVRSSVEGAKRVIESNGDYAVIFESPASHHYSNVEPCNTMVTHGYLDHKSFGLGFRKNSPLRETVNFALFTLIEEGTLTRLYEKWWHMQSQCEDPHLDILTKIYSDSLSIKEVSGAFYVLVVGILISTAAGIYEYFIKTKQQRLTMEE